MSDEIHHATQDYDRMQETKKRAKKAEHYKAQRDRLRRLLERVMHNGWVVSDPAADDIESALKETSDEA